MKREMREKTQTNPPRMAYARCTAFTCNQQTLPNMHYLKGVKRHLRVPLLNDDLGSWNRSEKGSDRKTGAGEGLMPGRLRDPIAAAWLALCSNGLERFFFFKFNFSGGGTSERP
jgi:hypothetical protein